MKFKSIVLVLALAVLTVVPNLAMARWVHDIQCDYCHKGSVSLDDVTTNVCLDCHQDGHGADLIPMVRTGGTISTDGGVFLPGDASDALGNGAAVPGDQTSHNWGASDDNPAAGASAPQDPLFYGRSNWAGASVSCARCHDPHGTNTDDRGVGTANPLLLKLGAGSTDRMCVDCHRTWDTTNAYAFLTHPMVANYASYVDDIKFKAFVGEGGMTLDASGNITCSTCHGVHFTDSDATTIDGAGSPINSGDGKMLKGNGRPGVGLSSIDGSSLCQTCHIYKQHGAAAQLDCLDCHSGHSYDPSSPNFFVLRNSINNVDIPVNLASGSSVPENLPGSGKGDVTGLNYATTDASGKPNTEWLNATNSGYCQKCHALSGTHNLLTSGGADATECGQCHTHGTTTGSFGGGCTSCHGYPPSQPPGKAAGYAGDETTAQHGVHAESTQYGFSCSSCHTGNTHDSGTFQDVGFDTVLADPTSVANYDAGTTTCSSVACHSNGDPRGTGATFTNPDVWLGGAAIGSCDACHGNTSASMGTKNNSAAHAAHLDAGYSCQVCHSDTADDNVTLASAAIGGNHVNGSAEVKFNSVSLAASLAASITAPVYSSVEGSCSIYCHSDSVNKSTPDWDDGVGGAACGTCHDATGSGLTGNSHQRHLFDADGPKLGNCTDCHTHDGTTFGGDHVNGTIDYDQAVCNACHGAVANGSGNDLEPQWYVPTTVSCETCHAGALAVVGGQTAPDKGTAFNTGHNLASGNYTSDKDGIGTTNAAANESCESCHDATAVGHFNGPGDSRLIGAFSCDTCHGTGGSGAAVKDINTHLDNLANPIACTSCHDPHGTGNMFMVKSAGTGFSGTVTFSGRTGNDSFDDTIASNNAQSICATCHTAGNQTIPHNNKENVGIHSGGDKQGLDCMGCHASHTDPTNAFAVGAGTSCGDCHGFPPTSALHSQHSIVVSSDKDTEDMSDCAKCHIGADSYTYDPATDRGNGLNHGDAAGRIIVLNTAGPAGIEYNETNKTCASACHTATVANGGTWTAAATLDCNACHGVDATGQPGGKHVKHIAKGYTCDTCHDSSPAAGDLTHIDVVTGVTDLDKLSGRADALADEATIDAVKLPSWNDTDNTCANTACHNPSGDASITDWDISTSSCTLCHSATDPGTGSHSEHMGASTTFGLTVACTDCHADNGVDMAHTNAAVDFAAGVTFDDPVAGSCSALACHNDGSGAAPAAAPVWGTPAPDCTICHIAPPATGDHAGHWVADRQLKGLGCLSCHSGTAASDVIASGATHIDGTATDVTQGGSYDTVPVTIAYAQGAPSTCTANCHAANPKTWVPPTSCNACHANPPNTGAHLLHTTVTNQDLTEDLSDCAACHAGADSYGYTASGAHQNGSADVVAAGYNSGDDTCASACHASSVGDGAWTDTALDCNACHGVDASGQPGGKHSAHIAKGYNCDTCHLVVPADTGHITDVSGADEGAVLTGRANALADEANVVVTTWNDTNNSCAVSACHNPSGDGSVADWDTDSSSCTLCHSDTNPGTNRHGEHMNATGTFGLTISCTSCHVDNTGSNDHLNTTVDFTGGVTFNSGPNTCSAAACHNTGSGAIDSPAWTRPASAADNCTICHIAPPSTGDHDGHWVAARTGLGLGCLSCHTGTASSDTIASGAKHIDGTNTDVTQGGSYDGTGVTIGYTQGSPSSCTANCHLDPVTPKDWAIPTSCNGCHGNPPATGAHVKHTTVTNQDLTEDLSDCAACHTGADSYGYGASGAHQNGSTDVVAAGYTGGADGTCASACHASTVGDGSWADTALNCNSCHGVDASGQPGGKHAGHIAKGYSCDTCHVSTPTDTSHITVATGADEGAILANRADALPDEANVVVTTWNDTDNSCAVSACHNPSGDASVADWDTDSSSCTLCHSDTDPATNRHTEHLAASVSTTFGLTISCTSCHVDNTGSNDHLNTTVDFTGGVTFTSGPNTCSAAACHNTGSGAIDSPAWTRPASAADNCTICHIAPPSTGDHAGHWVAARTGLGLGCLSCHTGTASSDTIADGAKHIDGTNTDVSQGGSYDGTGVIISYTQGAPSTCTANCHTSGVAVKPWDPASFDCATCHDNPPATGAHALHTTVSGNTIAEDLTDCAACHTGANGYGYVASGAHQNGSVDVAAAGYTGGANGTCASACHASTVSDGSWTDNALNCNSCHGVDASGQPGGKHTNHIAKGYSCDTCHVSTPTDTTHITVATGADEGAILANRGDAQPDEANVVVATWNDTNNTCAVSACHNPSGDASVADWDISSSSCTLCHSATDPGTGSHTEHMGASATFGLTVVCTSCHVDNAGSNDHLNTTVDFTAGVTYDNALPSPTNTCSALACHNDGTGSGAPAANPVWGTASPDCTICHAGPPATGDHSGHWVVVRQGLGLGCLSCHSGTAASDSVASGGNHINSGRYDVAQGGTYNGSGVTITYAQGAPSNCTTNCHASNPKNWALPTSCNACHDNPPATGAHARHTTVVVNDLTEDMTDCNNCHAGVDTYTYSAGGNHQNGSTEVTVAGYTGGANGTCATACHASTVGDGSWQDADALNCNACHGVDASGQPGGKHQLHIDQAYACNTCHDSNPTDTTHIDVVDSTNHGTVFTSKANALADEATIDTVKLPSWNDTNNTCSNIACHDPSNDGHAADFDTSNTSCTLCHSNTDPGTGSHTQHLGASVNTDFGITISCTNCHINNAGTNHLDGTLDFAGGIAYAAPNCTTSSCHTDGAGTNVPTPNWGRAPSTIDNCSICHADVMATNAHGVHLAAVGIHYEDIYSGTTGLLSTGSSGNVSHGDGNGTTISCNICHSNTVDTAALDQSATCGACHDDVTAVKRGDLILKAGSATHLNGTVNVDFLGTAFKSKAQLRDDISAVPELSLWSRAVNFFKNGTATSADTTAGTLSGVASWNGATCSTVACHNGIAVDWTTPESGNCMTCHTELPQ